MSLMAMAKKTGPGRIGRNLAIGAALLAAVSFSLAPATAYAQRGGGGRGGGGFHGGGFHGGGFHGGWHGGFAGVHAGHGGNWYHGWHGGRYGWWLVGPGLGWAYYDYPSWGSYPDYDYGQYSQPYTGQTWYYCYDPAGYYPYVTQCNTGWQTVPAS